MDRWSCWHFNRCTLPPTWTEAKHPSSQTEKIAISVEFDFHFSRTDGTGLYLISMNLQKTKRSEPLRQIIQRCDSLIVIAFVVTFGCRYVLSVAMHSAACAVPLCTMPKVWASRKPFDQCVKRLLAQLVPTLCVIMSLRGRSSQLTVSSQPWRRGGEHEAKYAYYYSSEKKNNGSNTLRKPYNSVK